MSVLDDLLTTRRAFLGSLLVLPAAFVIPNMLARAAERIIVPDRHFVFNKPGKIHDLVFWYRPLPGKKYHDYTGSFEAIRLPDGHPIMTIGINARATFRWIAIPGQEITVSPDEPVVLYMERIPEHTGHIWTSLGGDDTSQMITMIT